MNYRFLMTSCVSLFISGCATKLQQLSEVMEPPALTHIQNPTSLPTYQPIDMPMPAEIQPEVNANSLWQQGSKSFFKDMRASRIGDIITVIINIKDENISMVRTSKQTVNNANLSGVFTEPIHQTIASKVQKMGVGITPGIRNDPRKKETGSEEPAGPSKDTKSTFDGSGTIEGKLNSGVTLPCTIIQILGNGNMVLQGRQEFRADNEVRVLEVKGIIRREDVEPNNTIFGDKIAEARISYGGHGEISNSITQPYGHKLIKALAPY